MRFKMRAWTSKSSLSIQRVKKAVSRISTMHQDCISQSAMVAFPHVVDRERPAPSRPAHLCYNDLGVVCPKRHPNSTTKGYLSAA